MAGQFGGSRIGGVALSANGMTPQPFTSIPTGPLGALQLLITFGLISSGSSFALVVDTGGSAAAEGTDDLDLLLGAIFGKHSLFADTATMQGNEVFSRWRTFLGSVNVRDFVGNLLTGSTVPASNASAKTFQVIVQFPWDLRDQFVDGAMFHQGSTRISQGRFEFNVGTTLTPTVVLANGTAVVSGLSVQTFPKACGGTENDIAPTWQMTSPTGIQTVYAFDATQRLFVALQSLPSSVGLTLPIDIGPYERTPAGQFAAYYQAEQLVYGGFDITQRCTPLLYVGRTRRFQDFLANLGDQLSIDAASTNLSTLSLIDVKMLPTSPSTVQQVGQVIGAGGAVSSATIAPPSGQAVPAALGSLAPTRIIPGRVNSKTATVSGNPGQLAANHANRIAKSGQLAQVMKVFKRTGS
jgi:hypothetical protein